MMTCFGASLIATLCSFFTASQSLESQADLAAVQSVPKVPVAEVSPDQCGTDCHNFDPVSSEDKAVVAIESSFELIVDLSDRQVYLYEAEVLQKSYAVSIGRKDWETPIGIFQVTYKQKNPTWQHPISGEIVPPGPDNPLGAAWIGFWVNEGHQIGFHGTVEGAKIGEAISHGCVRMHNEDILELFDLVKEGWTVTVRP